VRSTRENSWRRSEVAVNRGQLGTVRLYQNCYQDALDCYQEAIERFTVLGEPSTVAGLWHLTGRAYQNAEAAQDAYRKSLAIRVRLNDIAGQAASLGQLGILYDAGLGRPEEAAALFRQAADKYIEIGDIAGEGRQRTNLAITLRGLGRVDEARREAHRAIECKKQFGHALQPWTSWAILAEIETDARIRVAAMEAKRKAVAAFLAYRRDGGENHTYAGRLSLAVTQALLGGDAAGVASDLQQLAADPDLHAGYHPFLSALQAVVAGSRDRALADSEDVNYMQAAEILFLIETLEQHQSSPPRPETSD
jgi:tetratricopeptide (TPR) repeat protein